MTLSLKTVKQLVRAEARSVIAKERGADRKAKISTFCERMVGLGKMTPAQAEAGKGPERLRLDRASSVARFGEGKSELELQMEEIEARPSRHFGERLAVGSGGVAGGDGVEAFDEKVKKHYEARNARLDRRA